MERGNLPSLRILGPASSLEVVAGQAKRATAAVQKVGPETKGPAAPAEGRTVRLPELFFLTTVAQPSSSTGHVEARSELALRFLNAAFARLISAEVSLSMWANRH